MPGPHVPVQPAGQQDSRADRLRRARRHLLDLDEPGEPRVAPAGRERGLGPRSPRLLDPPLLARGDPDVRGGATRGCIIPDTPDVAFINLEYPSWTIAHVELSWLAPSKLRRTTVVGSRKMVVYDDTSPEPVRMFDFGVTLARPGDVRRVPAHLPDRRHRLPAHRRRRAPPPRAGRLLRRGPDRVTPRSTAELGIDVVRMIEAVESSLEQNGVRVELAEAGAGTGT